MKSPRYQLQQAVEAAITRSRSNLGESPLARRAKIEGIGSGQSGIVIFDGPKVSGVAKQTKTGLIQSDPLCARCGHDFVIQRLNSLQSEGFVAVEGQQQGRLAP